MDSSPRLGTEPQLSFLSMCDAAQAQSDPIFPQKNTSPVSSPADFSPETSDWGSVFGEDSIPVFDMSDLSLSEEPSAPQAKKRGRKPAHPTDQIRKKTEEKDKFWLRAFRAHMKTNYLSIRKELTAEERFFWREYLSPEGLPDKGNRYSSFGRRYKRELFGNGNFVGQFQEWFVRCGEAVLLKKCDRMSPLWGVFYDYGAKDLFNYHSASPQMDSGSASPETRASPEPHDVSPHEEYQLMIEEDDGAVEMMLEEM